MNNTEFFLANGYVETTDEIKKKLPNTPYRWIKHKSGNHSSIFMEDDWSMEKCLTVINANSFNDGFRYGKELTEKNLKAELEAKFKSFIKKQFKYVK